MTTHASALLFLRPLILTMGCFGAIASVQADAVVSNLTATQRAGTKLVDITYDLAAPGFGAVAVTLEASSDGGATWTVPVASVTGAVGGSVTPGTGKAIVWNAGVDWPHSYSTQMRFRVVTDDLVPQGFSLIPGGSFTMGRTSGDTESDAPSITVTVSPFYIQQTETTKAQWDEVRNWAVNNGYTDLPTGEGKASNHPVQTVTWRNAVKWCNARSEKEGFTPVYMVSGAVMRTGTTNPVANWDANGYRLPTEAEWEKAARGGVSGKRFPWGTDTISHAQANYYGSASYAYDLSPIYNYHPIYKDDTSPVGSFAANGYGLYDMAGNVHEWCWDRYRGRYYTNGTKDPRGPASGAPDAARVVRGGGRNYGADRARCSYRNGNLPGAEGGGEGFRPARIIPQTESLILETRDSPTVTTPSATSIIATGATLGGTVVTTGGGRDLGRGVVYSVLATNGDPRLEGLGVIKLGVIKLPRSGSIGTFTVEVSNLSPSTSYAYCAYMTTVVGTEYSPVGYFTTDTPVTFASGIGTVSNRSIRGGERQLFLFDLAQSSAAAFSTTGASPAMQWELRDALNILVASGLGNVDFTRGLALGGYQLRISNPGSSTETFSLNLDASTPASPRPDISVGLDPTASSGVDLYDPPAPQQSVLAFSTRGVIKNVFFRIDNDGPLPDAMRINGPGSDSRFRVHYVLAGGNGTAAVIAGTATTKVLAAADAPVPLFVRINPNRKNTDILRKVVVSQRIRLVYGTETFGPKQLTVRATMDPTLSDTATFQLDTLTN